MPSSGVQARELDGSRVEVREAAFGIGRVDGDRERVDHFPKTTLTFVQSCVCRGQLLVVPLRRQVGNEHADPRTAVFGQRVESQKGRHSTAVLPQQVHVSPARARLPLPQQVLIDNATLGRNEIVQRRANQFFVRRLEQLGQLPVAPGDGAVRVQGRCALLHLFDK